jgi:hypothetical protein
LPPKALNLAPITGHCYCGATALAFRQQPINVAHCHCTDCRRWTGSAVGTFAAFHPDDLTATPLLGPGKSLVAGVHRWNCGKCGSPLMARFDYLPDQIYVPNGLLDQAANLPARVHCHADGALDWLNITDDLPRFHRSGRAALNDAIGDPLD